MGKKRMPIASALGSYSMSSHSLVMLQLFNNIYHPVVNARAVSKHFLPAFGTVAPPARQDGREPIATIGVAAKPLLGDQSSVKQSPAPRFARF